MDELRIQRSEMALPDDLSERIRHQISLRTKPAFRARMQQFFASLALALSGKRSRP